MIKVAVIDKRHSLFSDSFGGPMRVANCLCQEWEKSKQVELVVLSNALTGMLRFAPKFHSIRLRLLMQSAESRQFNVLSLHGISRIGLEIAKICKRRRIPIVYTAHGVASEEKNMGASYSDEFIERERQLLSLADMIVAVSPKLKELLIAHYKLLEGKVRFIYNGVDPDFGQIKYRAIDIWKKYGIPKNRKILINIGGTRRVKGIPFLVDALSRLERKDWHLVLIGGMGDDHENIIRQCKLILGDQFTFTGRVAERELLSFYHQALLCIAVSEYEPFGLTPLEAMSCGTAAAVRTTIGSARQCFCNDSELLKKNTFATPQELANIILNYLEGKETFDGTLMKGIVKCNSWENRAREYVSMFKQVSSQHGDVEIFGSKL